MTNKIIGIVATAGLLAGLAALYFVVTAAPAASTQPYGAVSALNQNPLVLNGIAHFYQPFGFGAASSTICSYKTPATSTIAVGVTVLKNPTGSSQLVVGMGTSEGATTTALVASYTVAQNAQATFLSTSTPSEILYPDDILPPNTWVNVNVMNPGNSLTGFCTFEGRGFIAQTQ